MSTARILVVDDDQALVYLLKENLELEGYRVCMGYDGGMAIEMAMEQQPDLIVLDINMPTTNGFDALTHLRKIPETKSIPVIFMTGIQSKTLYPIIDRHQRVAYVKKPVDLEHLNSLIRQFLIQYPTTQPPAKTEKPMPQSATTPQNYIEKID